MNDNIFNLGDELTMELGKWKLEKKEHSLQCQDCGLVASVFFYIMCYAQNQQSNLLQVITGYLAYTDNVPKQMAEILYWIELFIISKTVYKALAVNVKAIYNEF